MSVISGPRAAHDSSLVFHYDANNKKSYAGEPTTNLISLTSDSYPSVGSAWGTYHVELYNGATYFTIPSASVVGNLVTTATAHPFKTYSAVTPQTTAGGVTAGAVYYTKKVSSTQFTLHTYIGTQNIGWSAMSAVTSDIRVAITSALPLSWWGPPHQPNSTHLKEIISKGYLGIHDCMRVHFFRNYAGGVDLSQGGYGMANGVTPAITSGLTYTYSFKTRAASESALGKTVGWSTYTNGDSTSGTVTFPKNWTQFSVTHANTQTANTNQYWLDGDDTEAFSYDIAEIQIEQKSHRTDFTADARSNTTSAFDLAGNIPLTVANCAFDSNGQILYNGSNSYIQSVSTFTINYSQGLTVELWLKFADLTVANGLFSFANSPVNYVDVYRPAGTSGGIRWETLANWNGSPALGNAFYSNTTPIVGKWYHFVGTHDGSTSRIYLNGVLDNSQAQSNPLISNTTSIEIGRYSVYHTGSIASAKMYNKCLSGLEVLQSYNANKAQFGY
jgi:hypothetical protein